MKEKGSEVEATASVLDDVNRETGEDWRLEGRFAGGILGGAWRVSSGPTVAVLKWHDPQSSVPHNPDAPAVVDYLISNGYPTPAWLAFGTTWAGIPWSVQELIPGTPMAQLDLQGAQIIIELVEFQRRLSPPTSFSWSAFMRDQVFGRDSSHELVKNVGEPLVSVLDEALNLAAPYKTTALPETEMVHCDLSVSNILMNEGRLSGVIDIDAAGRGCAAYDALAPALSDVLWSSQGGPIEVLHEFAVDAYGPAPVAIAAATLVVEKLDGLAGSRPPDLEATAEKCRSWILAIERLL